MNKRFDNAKLFYCMDCKKTFAATPIEIKKAYDDYYARCKPVPNVDGMRIVYNTYFELNGHRNFIYREDEDYSEYLQTEKDRNS